MSGHTEAVGGREFVVDAYPPRWGGWSFGEKVAWLRGHTAPRADYAVACRILAAHRKAQLQGQRERAAWHAARRAGC